MLLRDRIEIRLARAQVGGELPRVPAHAVEPFGGPGGVDETRRADPRLGARELVGHRAQLADGHVRARGVPAHPLLQRPPGVLVEPQRLGPDVDGREQAASQAVAVGSGHAGSCQVEARSMGTACQGASGDGRRYSRR